MTLTREELEQWVREDRLEAGAQWYLVSTAWWTEMFPPTTTTVATEADGDVAMAPASDAKKTPVRNEPLVDLTRSSVARRCAVLKPQLAEERDYLLVSERVWNRLSHEFGFDWEIAREVIAHGPTGKLRVEVYPFMFHLVYWRSGMEAPALVVESAAGQDPQLPFVLLAGSNTSLRHVAHDIRHHLLPRLRDFFPAINVAAVDDELQIAYRQDEAAPWLPLEVDLASKLVGSLELEPRDYKDGDDRFHQLLVEAKFVDGDDWRVGRFYSDVLANAWRFTAKEGELVDARDTDGKWYESRIVEADATRVKVHYFGWTAKWDEWLDRTDDRLAPLYSKVPQWREFRVGDAVQIGLPQPLRAYPEWRNGVVTKLERGEGDDSLQVTVRYDGRDKVLAAMDEMLCRPGTHKASNAATITTSRPSSYSYQSSSYQRRDYSYEYGRGKPDHVGVVGLQNLGNTCFMNSMLQCLNNAPPLRDYFLARDAATGEPRFEADVNESNPLGMKGMIAREFAKLIARMWGGEFTTVSPTGLKSVIGQYAPQFAGYQQQDSQEVMNFILDGLHEDLNRVKAKPYTAPVERNGRSDAEVAIDEWAQYLRRNDSVIVEHFMGQLRSHVTCSNPSCGHESVTFDPFMNLSVPIPTDESVALKVQLFWADGRIPTKYGVRVVKDATLAQVKRQLSALADVPLARLFAVDVRGHRIKRSHRDATLVDELTEDVLHVYELEHDVDQYEFRPSSLRPLLVTHATDAKPVRLIALLHQAPVASPVVDESDALENGLAKQRRVEVELFNTPLLVSIGADWTAEQIHAKVWQVVQRLVAADSRYSLRDELPYRLHVTHPNDVGPVLLRDVPRASDRAVELPCDDSDYCFTLEWSRHGYQQGYDDKAAKRIDLHESLKLLRISTASSSSDSVSLLQCLAKFTEREQLGTTDTWYCPECKQHVRAFKKFDLFSLPRVLIFHLKRFRYAQSSFAMHRDKLSTLVTFPVASLDLTPFVIGPQASATPLVYDLFAVSEHSGGLGGGHYTAVGKNPVSGQWFSYNDSFTKPAAAEDAVTPRAYVLFYMRRE